MSLKKKPFFHLDSPRYGVVFTKGEVNVSGWFSDAEGRPAKRVEIRIGDRVEVAVTDRRSDVAGKLVASGLNPTGESFGFKKRVTLRRSTPYRIHVVVTTASGEKIRAGSFLIFNRVREHPVFLPVSRPSQDSSDGNASHETIPFKPDRYLVFVSHDASLTGAPMVLLRLVRRLSKDTRLKIAVVLMGDGPLTGEFEDVVKTVTLAEVKARVSKGVDFSAALKDALGGDAGMVVGNTVLFGREIGLFATLGVPVHTWIHELGRSIVSQGLAEELKAVMAGSSGVMCAAEEVRAFILAGYPDAEKRCTVLKPFIDDAPAPEERSPAKKTTVWCCGTPELRKGVDIAIDVACRLKARRGADFEVVWIGPVNEHAESYFAPIESKGAGDVFRFAGVDASPRQNYGDDIFLMPSREDPFPLVCLEAAQCSLPVVCFDGAGGMHEFVSDDAGIVVPHLDVEGMTNACDLLLGDAALRRSLGESGRRKVFSEYHDGPGVRRFLSCVGLREKKEGGAVSAKRVLVLSYGPPPLSTTSSVEGGGLRCWGLAATLARLMPVAEIHLHYHVSQGTPAFMEKEGVRLGNWADATLTDTIGAFDTIVISYCMGEWGAVVAGCVRPWQQLVLDCYVPIYVEVSARKPADMNREMREYDNDIRHWNAALSRGDYYLYANPNQRIFYLGVLSAIGVLNPSTYGSFNRLLHVPYGVYETVPVAMCDPFAALLRNKKAPRILWFGGVYPWFDVGNFLKAIKEVHRETGAELVMVGAKNPFVVNSDFITKYNELLTSLDELGLNEIVHLTDWVSFDTRADWFLNCDLIVTINREGMENEFAWRTRLVDYVWSGAPVATNGGDPLGEALIGHGAAIRLDAGSPERMAGELSSVLGDRERLAALGSAMREFRNRIHWSRAVAPLAAALGAGA